MVVWLHAFLILVPDGDEWSSLCPSHPWGKTYWYPLTSRLGGPHSQSVCSGKENKSLPCLFCNQTQVDNICHIENMMNKNMFPYVQR